MSTEFPAALDTLTNPGGTDALDSVTVPHATQHANANDAIEALQAKVGVDGSEDVDSLDYKVADLQAGKAPKTGVGATGTWDIDISGVAATANAGPGATPFADRNKVLNGAFNVNQRGVSGTVTLAAGAYGHDAWKAGASGCTYTFAASGGITTLTITAGSLVHVVEGIDLQTGAHVLSWTGTAQGKIGAGSFAASGVTEAVTGGTNTSIEFGTGTLSNVMLEAGEDVTPYPHRSYAEDFRLCLRRCLQIGPVGSLFVMPSPAFRVGTQLETVSLPRFGVMRATPTLTTSSPTYVSSAPSGNQIAYYDDVASAYVTTGGTVSYDIIFASPFGANFRCVTSGTFAGSAGSLGEILLGSTAWIRLSADL